MTDKKNRLPFPFENVWLDEKYRVHVCKFLTCKNGCHCEKCNSKCYCEMANTPFIARDLKKIVNIIRRKYDR